MPFMQPARILTGPWPTTTADEAEIVARLTDFLGMLRHRQVGAGSAIPSVATEVDALSWLVDGGASLDDGGSSPSHISPRDRRRIHDRVRNFIDRRDTLVRARLPERCDKHLPAQLTRLAIDARAMMITYEEADQIAAALHERAPWMAAASSAVMNELRRRTMTGAGLAGAPPMILTGPPGIGKSAWARHLADLLDVPVIHIDLGAAQSGAFSLVGVERGWGTASMGQLTRTILSNRIVNPVVIIDEIGIAQGAVASSAGNLPGIIPALTSLIEPTTASTWIDPYLQLGFDMSHVTWVMTTNAHGQIPQALFDRCRVVKCRWPTRDELLLALRRMGSGRLWSEGEAHKDPVFSMMAAKIADHRRISLRKLGRIVDQVEASVIRPVTM